MEGRENKKNDVEIVFEGLNVDGDYYSNCSLYCPPDCGCENAWNPCFIGD